MMFRFRKNIGIFCNEYICDSFPDSGSGMFRIYNGGMKGYKPYLAIMRTESVEFVLFYSFEIEYSTHTWW